MSVQEKRLELHDLINELGLSHEEVILASQDLDLLILEDLRSTLEK